MVISLKRQIGVFNSPSNFSETPQNLSQAQIHSSQFILINEGFSNKAVALWLFGTAGLILFMICLGGYTRLTKSGLSMTKWKPVGYSYPSSAEKWAQEFDSYKKTPEFKANPEMTLREFKRIFFIEYSHRLVGNVIGLAFGAPLVFFAARGYFTRAMKRRCLALFGLGGLQGVVGWWMVKSGFKEKPDYQLRPRVSTYRLMTHNLFAVSLYGYLLYLGFKVWAPVKAATMAEGMDPALRRSRRLAVLLLHFVALNLISGVAVAGIDAGKVFNSWPDMNGKLVPQNYWKSELGFKNLFENPANVQFNHRLFAYSTYAAASLAFAKIRKLPLPRNIKVAAGLLFAAVNWQVVYGIVTLLNHVPVEQGVVHQFSGMIVFSLTVYLLAISNAKYLPIKSI